MIVMLRRMGASTSAPSNLLRKLLPKEARPRKGLLVCITKACPGSSRAFCLSGACIMAVKRSVVGSGPIRWPGKSCCSRDRIKDVFPTEYWPRMSTMGLASKSLGPMGGEEKCENLELISKGSTFFLYSCFSPSKIKSLSTCDRSSSKRKSSWVGGRGGCVSAGWGGGNCAICGCICGCCICGCGGPLPPSTGDPIEPGPNPSGELGNESPSYCGCRGSCPW
mmetsp:Transcript_7669/g.17178  ORF Transcript_7669/g.17178 Transcript_7669/m.17178 type:complete len:222 (-) Transcript_7669:438-1103(-)